MRIPALFFTCFFIHIACFGQSQSLMGSKSQEELHVDKILKQLTLQEKIGLCAGAFPEFGLSGIKRLNIPTVKCTDGPRGPNQNGNSTAFPCGLAFGASWNPELVEQAGKVMGNETRAKKLNVLFGPAVNILRDPLNGRFFEYYTEDPLLNSEIAVANIKGIQSEGVAACLKHYACNNRENNRNFYMSMVDERTLNEIYLPAFKAGVQKGKVWTIMTSANGVNGEFVSDSKKMLTEILKNGWGYDGLVMTDFLQTRSTEKAALAGLDVSMPGGSFCGFGGALADAVKAGRVPESVIDDKVRRILRIYDRLGVLDGKDMSIGANQNTIEHQAIAQKVAEEGMVLLKNDRKLLPLNANQIKNVVVIGPNADKRFCLGGMGGGSSTILPPYEITALQGLKNMLGNNKVSYIPSNELGGFQSIPQSAVVGPDGTPGFKSSYFGTDQEHPAVNRKDSVLSFMWEMKSPDPRIKPQDFTHAHFEGKLIAPMDGRFTLRLTADGVAKMYHGFNNGTQIAFADRNQLLSPAFASVELKKGEPYELSIDYIKQPGDAGVRLEWELPQISDDKWAKITAAVKKADAVIFVGGLDYTSDTEGRDRNDLVFPGSQENLINKLSAINKNVVAVLINGSPMELGGWLKNVPAVLEA
ncbi:glycoside hydrolase family 3 domain protein [Mucilaginibacter paludis DSM 18603]|uniref:Glycoside hydrolase family 3 domain protein n=1 Tax=Mucilaginibacter paludis DSM 18603 TaxID=714943 RepID=H1YI83_9SPHI|nr:glycoside hydrolase family 3 domain protein [Mucilaginibacter paludis DSM 18603]